MKTINKKSLLSIERQKSYDFIAFAYTPWHAMGVSAAIHNLFEDEKKCSGIVLLCKHSKAGILISENNFAFSDNVDVKYYIFDNNVINKDILSIKHDIKLNKEKIYILCPKEIKTGVYISLKKYHGNKRKVINVVIDEGLATYMWNRKSWLLDTYITNNRNKKILFEYVLKYYIYFPMIKLIAKTCGEYDDKQLLMYDKNILVPNKSINLDYKWVLDKLASKIEIHNKDIYENSILIVTQQFYDDDLINDDIDLKILSLLVKEIRKSDKTVIVKPHPREKSLERYEALGCIVDNENNGSALENILHVIEKKPLAIIGYNSTALITSQVFENIPSVSLVKLFPNDKIATKLIGDFNRFNSKFSNVIYIPKTNTDCQKFLKKLVEN